MNSKNILLFLLILLVSTSIKSYSQRYYGVTDEEFGQSKIQRKRFDWKTIRSNNFELNFYRGGEELAKKSAKKAEEEYEKITETLGYTPFSVMKIYIYNSVDDLSQSNIGSMAPNDVDGGILNLSKARVQLAYSKNDSLFYNKLIKEIATLFVYDMLYGGSLKEAVQSQLLLMVPDWYITGVSAYIAEPDNNLKNQLFKETIQKNQNQKLSQITGKDAEIIGQSIWHYIASKYGKDNISNILNLTRIIRNEQSSITSTLGVSFSKFQKEWKSYYIDGPSKIEQKAEVVNKVETPKATVGLTNLKSNEIDTDNYVFDEVNVQKYKLQKKDDELSLVKSIEEKPGKFKKSTDELKISPVKSYKNLLVSGGNDISILMDPARRFGVGYKLIFNDLLENNVFTLKTYVRPSAPFFKNYDYSLSYGNYAKKIDYLFKFEKRSINFESIDESNNYLFRPLKIYPQSDKSILLSRRILSQTISASVIYPFTQNLKFVFSPTFLKTTDIEYDLPGRENINSTFLSSDFQLVFDNTIGNANGVEYGTKGKISYQRNINLKDNSQNFQGLNLDLRHYQKLVKGLVLAGRFNFGRSMGNAPKYSFLGGVENNLNRSIYDAKGLLPGPTGDFRDILFYNFPGQLRGFDFARLFGNNYILSNVELRAHLADYFPRSSLSSSFLRSLQVVGFYDIGTAWNGTKGPFSRQNSLNTILIGSDGISPFFAEVTNFKNPFLMGMGVGVRTTILGLFVKADYAVGKEDKDYNKPKLYISVGKDF
ncbi:hypothetical protein EGI22_17290 [Lacihabitans sp. LS3-19]|uniref:hypothetical protein n=1 Tax=Lacihabitans sp. LS3-19 TaxID=2487335 RepID=UPI0020CFBC54|nr:hypothetical protein [Lacihabitans sp. LS3-19]MCP9769660.1 hypothetical protein [Lacihabitans sp. LS3-19]